MKKLLLTMGLAAISAIGFGQSQRDEYKAPYALPAFTFADSDLNIDPLDDLKYGSMYLVKSSNHRYVGLGCYVLGTLALNSELNDNASNHVLSNTLFMSGTLFMLGSIVQERKGLERLYLGMNGVTIKLN